MSILKTTKDCFSWAKGELPADAQLEVYASLGRGRSLVWSEGKCEDLSQAEGGGTGIRVIVEGKDFPGRQGYAFTTGFGRESVKKAARNALASAKVLPADEFRKLPKPSQTRNAVPRELLDPEGFKESSETILERLRQMESASLAKSKFLKSLLRAGFSEGQGHSAIVNSNGIEEEFSGSHAQLGAAFLAEKDGERQEGGWGLSRRYKRELSWEDIFDRARERALALLGGKPIPTGKVPVVFDPSVACDFLSILSGMVCADSVQKGKSPFKGKIGEKVASGLVTIVDDGTLPGGLGTSPVDDEGAPTRRTPVISSGKLEHFLYDTYTALKERTESTGNASRGGFKSSPSTGISNFYLEAGKTPRRQIMKTSGLYLYDVMGLHMADPISGDFSVGAIGQRLEGGELREGVRGITLAGNLLDLLKNIDAVGDDLIYFGSLGSPTFRVAHLTVSGS